MSDIALKDVLNLSDVELANMLRDVINSHLNEVDNSEFCDQTMNVIKAADAIICIGIINKEN